MLIAELCDGGDFNVPVIAGEKGDLLASINKISSRRLILSFVLSVVCMQ